MRATMQDFPLTIHHILWRVERLFGRKEIVTRREAGVRRLTYAAFGRRVHRLAHALDRMGVKRGDVVASLAWSNDRHLELYYAVPCLGAVLHTLNLRLFPDQLEYIVKDAGDRSVFVDASLLPVLARLHGRIPSVERIVIMSDGPHPAHPFEGALDYETLLSAEGEDDFPWPSLDEREPAGMCYTSGTTGMPKGVVYSHRSSLLHSFAFLFKSDCGVAEEDVILPVVPMFHANAWGLPYAALTAGAKLVYPDRFMGDPKTLVELTNAEGVTLLAGVPTIWAGLLAYLDGTGVKLPSVTRVTCGGSAVSRGLMEGLDRHGLRIIQGWGMTETSPLGTLCSPRSWQEPSPERRLMQGPPIPGVELRIVDLETGAELPWDGTAFGEIHVRGPWVAGAYHGGADGDRFTADGWFRTGDIATVDPDGYVQIVDRAKDVIKSGGEWISSVELENALMSHPKVLEAAVVGLAHPKWQERPVAYVVRKPEWKGEDLSEELRAFLAQRVAKWWLPEEIRFIDEVPKTSVGKFDKKKLRAEAAPISG